MSKPVQVELERLRYWQGQRLRSRDFRDQLAIEAQLRWWHNRAVHHAYGVSTGLSVSAVPTSGTLRALQVSCGLAYDCFGRELMLQGTREIPVPPPPAGGNRPFTQMTLLLGYKEAAQFVRREDLAAVCWPCSSVSFHEEPDFVWQPTDGVQVTDGVPIARVNFADQQAVLDRQFTVPISRPLARPHLASGATLPEHTVWELWQVEGGERPIPIGAQTRIDTSASGFTRIPCYFAWLQGALPDDRGQPRLFPYFAHIAEASPTGFIFRLMVPSPSRPDGTIGNVAEANLGESSRQGEEVIMAAVNARHRVVRMQTQVVRAPGLYVCWVGCQMEHRPPTGCPGSMGG
jgi:hypothetical protein